MNFEHVTGIAVPQGNVTEIKIGSTSIWSAGKNFDKYICFTAQKANSSVKLTSVGSWVKDWKLYYSTNKQNWKEYVFGLEVPLQNIGDYVCFAGVDNITDADSTANEKYHKFVMSGKIGASGNCNGLLSQNDNIELKTYCYSYMFRDCKSLTQAPELPATTLASYCYTYMFYGCTSLTQAPALPATTLASYCYQNMFDGCTSLIQAPELPATTLATYCYNGMFNTCALTQAPALPATTLKPYCYASMFRGCRSLTQAPDLPATTLQSSCYNAMFQYCASLTSVKTAVTNWGTSNAANWLSDAAASGTVYCPAGSTIPSDSASGIPTGWSRVDWTPSA